MWWDDKLKGKAKGPRSYYATTTLVRIPQWDGFLNVVFLTNKACFSYGPTNMSTAKKLNFDRFGAVRVNSTAPLMVSLGW